MALLLKGWFSLVWDPHLVEWLSTGNPEIYMPKLQVAQTVLSVVFLTIARSLGHIKQLGGTINVYPAYYNPVARMIPYIILTATCSVLSLVAVATVGDLFIIPRAIICPFIWWVWPSTSPLPA